MNQATIKYTNMNTSKHYISVLEQACKIAEENINIASSIERIKIEKGDLVDRLNKDSFIRVPVVGDFSAGKSTLLNHCLLGKDLLPTDILPTTAVSYELWYSENEMLEIWTNDELRDTAPISGIGNLQVSPGDVVRVFLNNEKIKQLNDKGIVVVDMPGIGSGIEAHNAAIMNYIKDGSFFIVCVDIEQGTLRTSTLSFINELKSYSLSAAVIITKSDKKADSEIESVKATIGLQAKKILGDNVFIGVTSSANEQYGDFEDLLSKMDAEELVTKKYGALVTGFVNTIISELQTTVKLLNANKRDFAGEIEQLKQRKNEALESLRRNNDNAQPLEDSAGDILFDIENALKGKATQLAMILLQNKDDLTEFKAEMLSIIRPVLINSYRREISEYQDVIDNSLRDFTFDVSEVLPDPTTIDTVINDEDIQDSIKKVFETILEFLPIPPIVADILADTLLEIAKRVLKVFGKDDTEKVAEIRTKLCIDVFPQIIQAMKPEVQKVLSEQRQAAFDEIRNKIIEEAQKYDDSISAVMQEQIDDESTIREKTEVLKRAVELLTKLISE